MKPASMPKNVFGRRFALLHGARHPTYVILPLALVALALVLGHLARPAQANGSGTITIEKVSDYWGDDTSFDFSFLDLVSDFTLDEFNQEHTNYDIAPGIYNVMEILPDGWTLDDISCNDDNSSGDTGDATAHIELESGEHVTCTFTNSADPGSVTIYKQSDYWGDNRTFDFEDDIDGFGFYLGEFTSSYSFDEVFPGDYTVSEFVNNGWDVDDIDCDDDDFESYGDPSSGIAYIDVDPGEDVTCTFYNEAHPGTVTIYKESDYWGDNTTFDFYSTIDSSNIYLDEVTPYHEYTNVFPGDYTVEDNLPFGWTLDHIDCDDDDNESYGDAGSGLAYIDVDPGENVTCTFYNEADYGLVIIEKGSNYWGDDATFEFTDDIEGPGFNLDESDPSTIFYDVFPGDYTVTEIVPAGWTLYDITCGDDDGDSYGDTGTGTAYIDVDPGESVTCWFTNEVHYGDITIVKEADYWGENYETFVFDDDIYNSGFYPEESDPSYTFDAVFPGDYTVTELIPTGWTLDDIICVDDDGESYGDTGLGEAYIDLDPGEDVTCTFYNSADPGTVIIDKVVDVEDDTEFDFDEDIEFNSFTLSVPTTPSKTFDDVFPGDYTVTEDILAGWELDDVFCTDDDGESYGDYTVRAAYIDMDPGETVYCTFTNSQVTPPADLTIVKTVTGAGAPSDWSFAFTGDFGGFNLTDDDPDRDETDVPPGTFAINETNPAGYATTASCDNGDSAGDGNLSVTLDPSDDVVCTFTNDICQPGYYDTATGWDCIPSDPGYFVDTVGASQQTPCPPGYYQDKPDQASCYAADPGYYAPGPAATEQTACPNGTTSPAGSDSIDDCAPITGGPDRVFMSANAAGTTGDGLDFGSEDIIQWDGSAWSMWFDGSAAGLTPTGKARHNINALWIPDPDGNDLFISFAQNRRTVPGVGPKVDGMDIVVWGGAWFSFWFDGSDVGLTNKTQEKIDGLHVLPGSESPIGAGCVSYLLVSTQGPGKVPNHSGGQLKFGGEDVLGFCATSLGEDTAGLWTIVLDGSAEGMPRNSTDSISFSDDGQTMYLTTQGVFNVDAAAGGHSMVYEYDFGSGTFSGPVLDAPAEGLPEKVDGLQMN